MGAWPVLGTALKVWSEKHLSECLELCRIGSIAGDLWYATDILGERVPGPALVCDFDQTLAILKTWRSDPNPWVRRSIGVGIHVWTKRSQGKKEFSARAGEILSFLEPLFGEREIDAVKGIGWSLKTLGRFYPDLAFPWLRRMLTSHPSGFRPLMVRKAVTYFSPAQKKEIARIASGSEGPF